MLPAIPPSEVFAFRLNEPAEIRYCYSSLPTDGADICRKLMIGDDRQEPHHPEDAGPTTRPGLSVSVVDPADTTDAVFLRLEERKQAGHLVTRIASGEFGPLMAG